MKIKVVDINNIQSENFNLYRPAGREDYLFVLFKSPSKVIVDGEYTDADYGSFIIFDRYMTQGYYPVANQKFVHDFMEFNYESEGERRILLEIPKGKLINISFTDGITRILSEIKSEFNSSLKKYKKEIITNLGVAFLYRLKNEIENPQLTLSSRTHFGELYKLRLDIYANPGLDWSVENMSKSTCLSRSYFQHLYKRFFGISSTDDVINARIAYAKILLSTGELSINEISERCGYSYAEHFVRQFKSRTGVSPGKFRMGK